MAVGMRLRIDLVDEGVVGATVGLVLALALFVLHHATLFVQVGLVDRAKQVAHAIGFHEQRSIQRGGRHVLEIIGAVGIGGAVLVGHADLLERREIFTRMVFRTLEHQVFEQVREARLALRFVLRTHVVPDVHRDNRRLAVRMHDHAQAIGQGELLVGDVHADRCLGSRRLGEGSRNRADGAEREAERKHEITGAVGARRLGHGAHLGMDGWKNALHPSRDLRAVH